MNLKRIAVSIIASLMLLTACTGDAPEIPASGTTDEEGINNSDNLVDDYILFVANYEFGNCLSKLNIHTGVLTPMCSDSVCRHNDNTCEMYGVSSALVEKDGMLYYMKSIGYETSGDVGGGLYAYDLRTNDKELLLPLNEETRETFPNYFELVGDSLYCFTNKIDEDAQKAGDFMKSQYFECYRLDLKTKEYVEIGDTKDWPFTRLTVRVVSYDEDTIEWLNADHGVVTDYDFNIISTESYADKDYAAQHGDYKYIYRIEKDLPVSAYDYYIVDDSGEEKLIIDNTISWVHVDDKIVFTRYDEEKSKLLFSKDDIPAMREDYYLKSYNEIYVIDADGSNERFLGTMEDPYIEHSYANDFLNYAGGRVSSKKGACIMRLAHLYPKWIYDDEAEEYYVGIGGEDLGGYALVNINTNEIKVFYTYGEPYTEYRDITTELPETAPLEPPPQLEDIIK